jgi:GIY-YIG catalytic domain
MAKTREERRKRISSEFPIPLLDEGTTLQTKKGTADTTKATIHQDLSSLEDEVRCLVGGTSEKFVPQPNRDEIITDLVNGLRRFKDAVRWKDFHRLQQDEREKRLKIQAKIIIDEPMDDNDGLGTGLKPTKVNLSAPRASEEVEFFLQALEGNLLEQAFEYNEKRLGCKKSNIIKGLQKKLMDESEMVVIPTDKTNSFRIVPLSDYVSWVKQHLDKYGKEIPRSKLIEVTDKAMELLEEKRDFLSMKETLFLKQSIDSKAIPSPKLLIKDHKKVDNKGNFPTRLVVPANNFTSAFPKLGYLGIKKILDANNVNYMKRTIIQASDLKSKLENLGITCNNSTIVSIDAVDYYPSIKFKLVKKAVHFFSENLQEDDQIKIEECLDMIKFGMSSTLLTFVDKYYEYDGDKNPEEKGLTIGGYESAWLADLVGAFILEKTQQLFREVTFYGLYRDDGIGVFKGIWSVEEISKWRNKFQNAVDILAGGNYLQFTCNVWLDNERQMCPITGTDRNISVERGQTFPYLDMELFWSQNGELNFRVHLKPNQMLKYLNQGSAHTKACLRAIPAGVCKRLAKLTSINNTNRNQRLDLLYPHHFKALENANLLLDKIPTLQEAHNEVKLTEDMIKKKTDKERNRRRSTFFCIGYSRAWTKPIHQIIKETKKKFNLDWLRVSMSYHRFTNLREIFQGDLSRKLTIDVISKDFEALECNCRLGPEKKCGYNNMCRRSIVVYKVECKNSSKAYIGNTQQHFKRRMQQHFNDTKRLHQSGEKSDSYAKHFASQLSNFENLTPELQRNSITCKILWQGNPINVVKTFGTPNCALCNKERLEILKLSRKNPESLINSCNEIYGACRHNPKFHRYKSRTPSTDESNKDERVTLTYVDTATNMMCGKCLTEV